MPKLLVYTLKKILKKEKKITLDLFKNIIINDDALNVLDAIPADSIDLVVTSPPYDDLRDYNDENVRDFHIFKKIAKKLYRVMKKGATIVRVVGDKVWDKGKSLTSYRQALFFQKLGFKIYDVIIYEKTGSWPPHPNRYFNCYEYIFIITKWSIKTVNLLRDKLNKWGEKTTFANVTRREKDGSLTDKGKKTINKFGVRTNIWKYTNGKNFSTRDQIAYEHPAIFPEKLVEDNILSWSNEWDVVLDLFGWSWTTPKIARKLNRERIYIEKVKKYCEIAAKRLSL